MRIVLDRLDEWQYQQSSLDLQIAFEHNHELILFADPSIIPRGKAIFISLAKWEFFSFF